ncbi:MAG: DNA repair protein RadA [Actinomycetota bacterium]|nr:DNA repair protein RadA [Actinomycetota bacterium]
MCARTRTVWRCQQCGASAPKWLGRCPDCAEYGTYVEEIEQPSHSGGAPSRPRAAAVTLSDMGAEAERRLPTGVIELDRVLGGGLVEGSLVLIGGEPGIGKSTLLLQASESLSASGKRVLYVCGEESPSQIGMRARRLGVEADRISLLPEVDVTAVEAEVRETHPDLVVVDSIQTAYDPELASSPGSVGQVRACTARLMRIAKDLGVTTLIVGHVTKDGAIAGPRVLEHMVDTVLYFEGDSDHAFRIVRAVKNRFGSVSEIGIFEMGERGLTGVGNPSALLLGERAEPVPGSVVMPTMEGSRPLLVEVQALVTPSYLQVPRRLATGVETSRLLQVLAVLERRCGLVLGSHDVYVSAAGGVRIAEPSVDLPLAIAVASALRDTPVPVSMAAFGEIDLTGRVRPVPHSEARFKEAAGHGLRSVLARVPAGVSVPPGVEVANVSTLSEALSLLTNPASHT